MTVPDGVRRLTTMVRSLRVPGALNLYDEADSVAWGDPPGAATARLAALTAYLTRQWSAPLVLVGEAPGQHGARWTGVPFTSPHLLTGSGPREPTATIVQRVLDELGCASRVLLWNASVLFPPGNRDPRRVELEACAPALERVSRGRRVVAVGRHAGAGHRRRLRAPSLPRRCQPVRRRVAPGPR